MPRAFRIRKDHGPPRVRGAANDLPVDEVADPAYAEQEGAGDHHLVGQRAQRRA